MNGLPISGASAGGRRIHGRGGLLPLLLAALVLLVTACSGGGSGGNGAEEGKKPGKAVASGPSEAVVTIRPKDGAESVGTSGALKVTASKGELTSVEVKDSKGNTVEGRIAKNGSTWTPTVHLASETEYRVHAVAKDSEGRESAKESSFTTLIPANTFIGHFTPEDGSKVGVGMPVSLRFTRGITDPEAVEKAIGVTAEPAVEIRSKWYGNDRLDFRPEEYWKPGTKVTLNLNLDGVEGRPGVYGKQAKKVTFTIGRSQVSTVDAKKHTMVVERDGKVLKKIPITAGAPSTTTYNGQMVISEKHRVTRMNGETVGFGGEYDIADVPDAMRLSTSGTFIHGNYWASPSTFGSANVSHGCVGLRDVRGAYDRSTPAAWFFDNSIIGDVVVVKNSDDKQIQWWNGLNGWNLDWDEWKKQS
ncbi:Ig-like domain-containing protein [Streptomyces sp. GC420]|uniref:L,D-transpeptidase n=1 Tax=Streptomyces sp. GC420 TaxID=2697568 RepID=UPI001414CF70|nr:Ig-like domain-containing protein [Streptomyces sp. GC420]NBM20819.1 L,D-transpeptidase family protein [Streptomyces sp. GC420]